MPRKPLAMRQAEPFPFIVNIFTCVLFLCPSFLFQTEAALVGYWPLDELSLDGTTPGYSGYCPSLIEPDAIPDGALIGTTPRIKGTGALAALTPVGVINCGAAYLTGEGDYLSVSAWINVNDVTQKNARVFFAKSSVFTFYRVSGDLRCRISFNNEVDLMVQKKDALNNNQWYHVVAVYDGTQLCLFINKNMVQCEKLKGRFSEQNGRVLIGSSTYAFNGYIDDARVYDHALTQTEIDQLYGIPTSNDAPDVNITLGSGVSSSIIIDDQGKLEVPVDASIPVVAEASDQIAPFGSSSLSYEWSVLTTDCGSVVVNDTLSFARETSIATMKVVRRVGLQVCVSDGELATLAEIQVRVSPSMPVLVEQPSSETQVLVGQELVLRVVATANPPPVFQWQELGNVTVDNSTQDDNSSRVLSKRDIGWVDIANATSATFRTIATFDLDGQEFRCYVSSRGGYFFTDPTTVRVLNSGDGVITDDSDSDFPAGAIAGIVVGAFLLCLIALLLAILVVVLIVRRRRSPYRKLKQPDYQQLAFADCDQYDVSDEDKYEQLEELLSKHDHMLALAVISTADTSDMDSICRDLMRVAQSKNKGCELLGARISHEVASASDEGTLFRANSAAPKLFATLVRIVALQYIWHTLVLQVNLLNDNAIGLAPEDTSSSAGASSRASKSQRGSRSARSQHNSARYKRDGDEDDDDDNLFRMSSMEVDPMKLDDASDAKVNTLELWLVAQKLFRSIQRSEPRVPLEIRRVIEHIHREIGDKFSSRAQFTAMGGFYFLRLICPAILAPHVYGLIKEPAHPIAQRQLILIAKVLQNLANDTLPGNKESYMMQLNEFITNNKDSLEAFYDTIVNNVDRGRSSALEVPDEVRLNSLASLHAHIHSNEKQIVKWLQDQEDEDLADQLHSVLDSLGDPVQTDDF